MPSAGDIIREYRTKAELSLEEVAAHVGVTFGAVSGWEKNRYVPSRAKALRLDRLVGAEGKLAHALGYSMPDLDTEEVTQLRAEVARLSAQVADLSNQVGEMLGAFAELRTGRAVGGSGQ